MASTTESEVDLEDLKRKLEALGPAPWRHADGLSIDYGYVDAQGKYTLLMGECGEGAVDEDNPEGIALVALRNAADAMIAELQQLRDRTTADAATIATLRDLLRSLWEVQDPEDWNAEFAAEVSAACKD